MFHNLSRYDPYLFIRELGKRFNTDNMGVIAESEEKYISFTVDVVVGSEKKIQLRFIDSIRSMASSVSTL